jgi:hypothetical protein
MTLKHYSELDALFVAALSRNDAELVGMLLETFLNSLDAKNLEQWKNKIDQNIGSFAVNVVDVINKHLGMSESAALSYVHSRLMDVELDRDDLTLAVKALGNNYGAAIAASLSSGDDQCIREIFDFYGEAPVSVTFSSYGREAFIGKTYYPKNFPMRKVSPDALLNYLDMAKRIGLLDPQSESKFARYFPFTENAFTEIIEPEEKTYTRLPYIQGGRVEHPELLLAMVEMSEQHPGVSQLYQRIPVWFDQDMGKPTPEASVFNCVKTWDRYTGDDSARHIERTYRPELYKTEALDTLIEEFYSQPELNSSLIKSISSMTMSWSYPIEKETNDYRKDLLILKSLLTPTQRFGFLSDKQVGLAVVGVDELSCMRIGSINAAEMERARQSVKDMINKSTVPGFCCPSNYDQLDAIEVGMVSKSKYTGFFVEQMAEDHAFKEEAVAYFGSELIKELVSNGWGYYSGRAHAFLQKEFDLVCDYGTEIDKNHVIEEMFEFGYRFEDKSPIRIGWSLKKDPRIVNLLIAMNYWPDHSVSKPLDVFDGLKALVRKPDNLTLRGYLLHQGVEAVCKVAKTEPQWQVVTQLFADQPEVMSQYAPSKFKRDMLSRGLDL